MAENTRLKKPGLGAVPEAGDSLPEFVYGRLRSAIRNRELKPGDRLRETELAGRLGVSRTPVREALKRLEADGLTRVAPPRGFVVTELTHARVMELYAMREVLAGVAARFAAEQSSPMEIQTLQELIAQQAAAKDADAAARLNDALRAAITSAAHNEYLTRATNSLNDALELLGRTTYSVPGRIRSGWKENKRVVEAIARGNGAAAEEAARLHVRNAAKLRVQMLFGKSAR
ncbi:MAG TPA: GntR family transcriptional regulator [Steroidobacteraceae bacterium]|nr:GntR family transcriptional regulator [Steroidobacteraceae bacterium]